MNPLGLLKNSVESIGMEISFVYEDLIFLEQNGFLLQFTENAKVVQVHTNEEADEAMVTRDISRLIEAGRSHDLCFIKGKVYTLNQGDGETIRLEFAEVI
jgi:hypothetical protein